MRHFGVTILVHIFVKYLCSVTGSFLFGTESMSSISTVVHHCDICIFIKYCCIYLGFSFYLPTKVVIWWQWVGSILLLLPVIEYLMYWFRFVAAVAQYVKGLKKLCPARNHLYFALVLSMLAYQAVFADSDLLVLIHVHGTHLINAVISLIAHPFHDFLSILTCFLSLLVDPNRLLPC